MKRSFAHIRQRLIDEREAVLARLPGLRAVPPPELERPDIGPGAGEPLAPIDERSRRVLDTIDLALARLAQGSYGRCEDCQRPIDERRMETMPEARLCGSCAEAYVLLSRRLPPAGEVLAQQAATVNLDAGPAT